MFELQREGATLPIRPPTAGMRDVYRQTWEDAKTTFEAPPDPTEAKVLEVLKNAGFVLPAGLATIKVS